MTDNILALNARDDLLELAERYETVVALDLTPDSAASEGRAAPGSRLPPGMQEVLDADELHGAVTAVAEWAEFLAHVIADEKAVTMPDATPARLRTVAEHTTYLTGHDDEMLALAFSDDLHEHLRVMRRLSKRGVRPIRTGMRCERLGCKGQLISPLGRGGDRHDDALRCERCGNEVPHSVWSRWPRARVQYVTVEHAARIAGTTVAAVKIRASRGKWRKIGTGREVRYSVEDVKRASGIEA